jgi:hypothetical protein
MPFSPASFRARGDANTRSPFGALLFSFIEVDVVLLATSSFSLFSGLGVGAGCSSAGFFFAVDVTLPSSLKSLNAAISSFFSTIIAHN